MPAKSLEVEVATNLCARYINLHESTPRKPLAVLVRDGSILDEMENRTLLRAEKNRTEYFPTLGSFALLEDEDPRLSLAHDGVVRVLHTLANLYETREDATQYSNEELIGHVQARYPGSPATSIRLGLYLSVTEFGVIRSFKRSDDGLDVESFTIAEQALKVSDPESAWAARVVLSRNNLVAVQQLRTGVPLIDSGPGFLNVPQAESPFIRLQERTRILFNKEIKNLYDFARRKTRELTDQYSNEAIAAGSKFGRMIADLVFEAFDSIEQIFEQVYIRPFEGKPLDGDAEQWLKTRADEVVEEETKRASDVTRELCMGFFGASGGMSAHLTRVSDQGKRLRQELDDSIKLLTLVDPALGSLPAQTTPTPAPDPQRVALLDHLAFQGRSLLKKVEEQYREIGPPVRPEDQVTVAELEGYYKGVELSLTKEFGNDSEEVLLWNDEILRTRSEAHEQLGLITPRGGHWPLHFLHESLGVLTQIKLLQRASQDFASQALAFSALHTEISEKCQRLFAAGEYDLAIFAAFKTVEEAVRARSGASPTDIGVNLITKTMNANAPILKFSDIFAEQEGHVSLYRGAIAVIKNPLSHRKVGHKSKARAFELIAFASTLMRMLDDVPPAQTQP